MYVFYIAKEDYCSLRMMAKTTSNEKVVEAASSSKTTTCAQNAL